LTVCTYNEKVGGVRLRKIERKKEREKELIRNVGNHLPIYTEAYFGRLESSSIPLCEL